MKKNLEKIFASASIIVALVLVMILTVTAFGGISTEDFNSPLVRGLIVTLAILYVLLSVVVLILAFSSNEIIKEITLRTEQEGSVKATKKVVTKMVKETCALVEGVKCNKVTIITNDYGVRLRVDIKIKDKDVVESELTVRSMLEDKFLGELGFRFHSIEIKITALQSKYQINKQAVDQKVQTKMEELRVAAEKAAAAEEAAAAEKAAKAATIESAKAPVAQAETVQTINAEVEAEAEYEMEAETVTDAAVETVAEIKNDNEIAVEDAAAESADTQTEDETPTEDNAEIDNTKTEDNAEIDNTKTEDNAESANKDTGVRKKSKK